MQKKILFVYTNFSTFVRTDYEILSKVHNVTLYQFKPVKGLVKTAWQMIRQKIFLLFNIWRFDVVYVWFADYHSFLPVLFAKLFGKKSFVVVGGYDICRIRSLNYGVFISKFRGFFSSQSIKFCTLNLTVSKYVDRKVKWLFRNAKTQLIYNCVRLNNNIDLFNKKDLVLTVGQIDNEQTFLRKGIDTFFEVAKLLPDFKFIVVGIDKTKLQNYLINISENVILFKKVKQIELTEFYSEAKFYAQFSRMDTFCLTLAEAMLFGCYPIITNEGGMQEVIGEHGKIVKRNSFEISAIIKNTIIPIETNQNIIEYINYKFSPKIREQLILELIAKNFRYSNL